MKTWLDVRPIVLDEIIGLDGPGDVRTDFCGSCLTLKTTPLYCCLECSYSLLLCGECTVNSHQALPLHRLEVRSFHTRATTLTSSAVLEGRIFRQSTPCPFDSPLHDLLIVDANGWHKLRVQFCGCKKTTSSPEHYCQLLRMRWYPASFNRPRTAFVRPTRPLQFNSTLAIQTYHTQGSNTQL
ncbi:hypothetical protein BJ322DRAFT_1013609 [Thelephora terrestris]|uniref:CxC2-like cysteine cluster KDZ transposase-associated domain-containing protein n=1 Tax=Thelephora terrestris TaxID=56493 RepID=A0A9P6L221_9AGAM|nr:hypothetical protein BJ322DRAFT_1013609 [Thelephora terrestris]